ncbi:cyclin-dependent kinase inhibitor 1C [Bactrocera dorsalis]|uniref:Cyclin-dependent kinase inhibitor 1C n=1 Tax=Bactrocera dorsalis TaxID=27457 RepID=A0A6I9VDV6_BACDO|nr:cyclin-dependent kinase inhibitor 1C [Bactrocera dorsalis]
MHFQLLSTLLCLLLTTQRSVEASYIDAPNVFNEAPNVAAFATPIPCDSPSLQGYGAAAFAKPLVFASYPVSYAQVPQYNYAAPAPAFVKYAAQPRVKVTAGLPVTTTYTTAVGFAAPQVPNVGAPLTFPAAPAPATFAAPTAAYGAAVAFAAPPPFLGPASYAAPTVFSAGSPFKKFRAPLPVAGYSYAQGIPNAAW